MENVLVLLFSVTSVPEVVELFGFDSEPLD